MNIGILPPELKSIEQLFSGSSVYQVPKYQRSFAWGNDEIEELWEDIELAQKRDGDYFLGTIVLQQKEPSRHDIIDGQQRLACLSMIFASIRNFYITGADTRAESIFHDFLGARGYEKDAQPIPNIRLNETNNETYVQYVIESRSLTDVAEALKDKHLDKSNKLLLEAYKFFLDKVAIQAAALGTKADTLLVPLINCLRSRVKFITIPVNSEDDANLFFESLNARGKELAVSDLVKNRLYFEASDQVHRAQQLWGKMEADLLSKSIPDYLRHYWIAKQAEETSLNVREKNLYKSFASEVKGNQAKTLALLKSLADSASGYVSISDYNLWPDDPAYADQFEASIRDLRLFRVTQCNPLLLNAIEAFGSPKAIARTFKVVANFSFRYFIIGNQSPGILERESGRIAYGIRKGTCNGPDDVAKAFQALNSDNGFRSDFCLATIPKSRAAIARYTLYKINNHISKKSSKSGGEQIANPDAKDVTLEHVLPQNFGSAWKAAFSKGVDPADYVFRIGNLTLLRAKVNGDAANKSFQEKKKLALDTSVLPINAYFSKLSEWSETEIEARQEFMAKQALEIWAL